MSMPPPKSSQLEIMRHSCAHIMATAVMRLWPETKLGIGPAIEEGFYYDFDFGKQKFTETDLKKISASMIQIIKAKLPFVRGEITISAAKKIFAQQPYKLELLGDLKKAGAKKVSLYQTGDPSTGSGQVFVDLCLGPHVGDTSQIGPFKLLSIAGAYWKGSEKNKMLTRIYGTCFPKQAELDQYLWQQEEAKKRDHRQIGKTLELFTFSDEVGAGLPLWLPKGTVIREELEKWAKETEKKWGYQRVATPHITRAKLYEISGHLPYFAEEMYSPINIEDEKYYLKPMNCPHHHMIYKSKIRSYKDLPLRLAEYGQVYRFEKSGVLHGLFRVRGFCQNDAHIYVQEEKAVEEFVSVLRLHQYYYEKLGIGGFKIKLGLRDPKDLKKKYHGDEEMWQKAEQMTKEALKKAGVPYTEDIGGAVHYGPKGDIIIQSAIGKEYAIGTIQIDLYMPQRFNLTYIDKDGRGKFVVVIHRAPLGSHERFIGFLIEHYRGAFPLWLSPVQVMAIPIAERHVEYVCSIARTIENEEIRVEMDDRSETMQAKIRDATLQKVPYMVIIGDREIEDRRLKIEGRKVSVRTREGKDLGQMKLAEFLEKLKKEIENKE